MRLRADYLVLKSKLIPLIFIQRLRGTIRRVQVAPDKFWTNLVLRGKEGHFNDFVNKIKIAFPGIGYAVDLITDLNDPRFADMDNFIVKVIEAGL